VPNQVASELETWQVRIGETARGFIQGIDFLSDEQRKENILVESQKILSRCSNPSKSVSRKSILVLGEVQSGKTLSFTSVIALARDNEIPITILLAGTKKPLMKQNYEQLVKDLNRNSSGSAPQWFITNNTKNDVKEEVIE
jgi:superfamily II DNA or RNA helicase